MLDGVFSDLGWLQIADKLKELLKEARHSTLWHRFLVA
jgi:hypothetical protein